MTSRSPIADIYFPPYAQELSDDHPVRLFFVERQFLKSVMKELNEASPVEEPQLFFNVFNQLCEVEKRFARKENQLFPFLEKRGWFGPSQGMWSFHDAIRDQIRSVRSKFVTKAIADLKTETRLLLEELDRLLSIEEMRLFPNALNLLTPEDWTEMQRGEVEIGWMMPLQPRAASAIPAGKGLPFPTEGRLHLDEGWMLPEQINLLLKFLPFDLTYVDENDRVIFYNRGEVRVFPRSAAIIGREVRFCHPPKSVDTVLRIVEAFRSGEKDDAEFWIRHRGRMLHIRYFAIRDNQKRYKGVVEVSQDITEIQKLEGERRLLNWDEEQA
jgi:hypothetical protein